MIVPLPAIQINDGSMWVPDEPRSFGVIPLKAGKSATKCYKMGLILTIVVVVMAGLLVAFLFKYVRATLAEGDL
jgi:hypothetical protein